MKYYEKTLRKLRKRKKKLKCKFQSVQLKVDGRWVNLPTFRMIKDVDYHHQFRGIVLNKRFEFKILWLKGDKPKYTLLVGEKGFWYDGASIPKMFQDSIGKPLDPRFMVASLAHDMAIQQEELPHKIESMILYKLLHYQKGCMDLPWWKERAMFLAVYSWSILSS